MPRKEYHSLSPLLIAALVVILVCGCGGGSHETRIIDDGTHKWTFLVYMTADNDLEPYAIQDFNELERVGSDQNISVIVQIDRSPEYDTSNGNWTTTRRYYVTQDGDPAEIKSTLLDDLGETDMASPDTLRAFVEWGATEYSADHYVLVMWNHGRGWQTRTLATLEPQVKAIHWDQTSGTEMSLPDLTQALTGTQKMDIIAFDACLMAMIEVAYSVRDGADILVASEENVPAQGQPYQRILSTLHSNPGMSPTDFSQHLVSTYVDYYASTVSNPVTYSAIDLTSLSTLVSGTDQLASSILNNLDDVRAAVRTAQQKAQWYDHDASYYDYYKDLRDFARLVELYANIPDVRTAAGAVRTAVEQVVIAEAHSGSQVANSHGVSIYLPDSGTSSTRYLSLDFAADTHWDEMLAQY